jgi:hypothetical protein
VLGDLDLLAIIRPVDLGHQGLKDRGTGRHLGDLDAGALLPRDILYPVADAFGDLVTLQTPLLLRDQVDLNVRDVRPPAEEVVPHQSVEIVGCGGSGIDLIVEHRRLFAE